MYYRFAHVEKHVQDVVMHGNHIGTRAHNEVQRLKHLYNNKHEYMELRANNS